MGEKVSFQQSNATVGDRFMVLKSAILLQRESERERENDEYYEDKCHQNKLKDMQPYSSSSHSFRFSLPFLAHIYTTFFFARSEVVMSPHFFTICINVS